jgi:transcriptional regulator with XRE-family HTH domain
MAQIKVDARSIFAQRLKQAREDAGLTQKELGTSVGLPQEAAAVRINRYEKAVHDADLATARRIAEALGVPLAFLYADTDVLAEAILTLGLLSKSEQRKAVPT